MSKPLWTDPTIIELERRIEERRQEIARRKVEEDAKESDRQRLCVKVVCTSCRGQGCIQQSCMGSDNMDIDYWTEGCDECSSRGWQWAVPYAHLISHGPSILKLDER